MIRFSLLTFCLATCTLTGQEPQTFDRLTIHATPSALTAGAVTADWPRVLGPNDDLSTPERPLRKDWPKGGPTLLWEVAMGEGYTSPAVSGDFCVIFHAMEGKETVECLNRETGKRYWARGYPIEYQDRYGFGNGPRGSPVIAEGVVVTLGVTSMLCAHDLRTGAELWRKDLRAEYHVPQDFFGAGSSPLIHQGRVIVNVGGKAEAFDGFEDRRERARKLATKGVSVAAFDLHTGSVVWKIQDEWGASYASPVLARLHGQEKVLIYAGGESDPAIGGLLCVDPASGTLHDRFPWRDEEYIQATGSSPMIVGEKNRAFITTCYPKNRPLGGVMVEYDASFKAKEIWRSTKVGVHWMTPLYEKGQLYAIDGERENNARLVAVNAENGEEVWAKKLEWQDATLASLMGRNQPVGLGLLRASLIRADGHYLCLGETGSLHWLRLTQDGCEELRRCQLFYALQTWSAPVLSHGLLYIRQQEESMDRKKGRRLLCYDLRGSR